MKKVNSVLQFIKLLIKYSAYIIVFIDILQYIHKKITEVKDDIEKDFFQNESYKTVQNISVAPKVEITDNEHENETQ